MQSQITLISCEMFSWPTDVWPRVTYVTRKVWQQHCRLLWTT